MNDPSESIATLKEIIVREIERHPHSQALLEAFRPVLIQRQRMLEDPRLGSAPPAVLDEARFRGGVPVMGQHPLTQAQDPWDDLVLAMIPAVKEGFPELGDNLTRLEAALRGGEMALFDFFKEGPQKGEAVVEGWAKALTISAPVISFFLRQVSRAILGKRARGLRGLIQDATWEKGYCPICGAFPSVAVIKEKLGERLLHCSCCGHDWRFSRVICPYCEYEGQKGMNFFFVEDKEQESVYTCDQCGRYLITLSRMSDLNERNLDVSALGLVHLDMVMQEKNFTPMAVTDWNIF
jgi:FdhE protein